MFKTTFGIERRARPAGCAGGATAGFAPSASGNHGEETRGRARQLPKSLSVSVVIPTYNEAGAIQETLRRACIALATCKQRFEVIVVDDSSRDGTAELAEALSGVLPVRVLRRAGVRGLATAVVDGWRSANGALLGVMDGDLQHPPELLPALIGAFETPDVDLAVASRYLAGGGTSEWRWTRRVTSRAATQLATCCLPWALAQVSDTMSGMFVVRAAALKDVQLDPAGYKILLEVLAKARYRKLVEVPFTFGCRRRGSSKLGPRQYLEYLQHLVRLARSTGHSSRLARYLLVGSSGALVNLWGIHFAAGQMGWPLFLVLPATTQIALLSNFFCNHLITFHTRETGAPNSEGIFSRLLRYEHACGRGALWNVLVTLVLLGCGVPLFLAAVAGIIAGGARNFFFSLPSIWRVWDPARRPGQLRRDASMRGALANPV